MIRNNMYYRIDLIWRIVVISILDDTVGITHGLIYSCTVNVMIKCRIKIEYGVVLPAPRS